MIAALLAVNILFAVALGLAKGCAIFWAGSSSEALG